MKLQPQMWGYKRARKNPSKERGEVQQNPCMARWSHLQLLCEYQSRKWAKPPNPMSAEKNHGVSTNFVSQRIWLTFNTCGSAMVDVLCRVGNVFLTHSHNTFSFRKKKVSIHIIYGEAKL